MTHDLRNSDVQSSAHRRSGFTLLQLLVVVSVLAVLSAILFGVFGRGRAAARRANCDVHLKEIAMALDTYRQENGRLPLKLKHLADKKYVSLDTLRCPSDPDLSAQSANPSYISYEDFYVLREPRDSGELPILVCPLHEKDGLYGAQAYKGRYTTQFAARPAMLKAGDFSGTVTVTRPGEGVLSLPVSADKPLMLRGADRIRTGSGTATIRFADGSYAEVDSSSEITVMQSYIEGQRSGPLYTLVRQFSGRVSYTVNTGSHFDVATPTATAGALGTVFDVTVQDSGSGDTATLLTVREHVVALTTVDRTIEVEAPVENSGVAPVAVNPEDPEVKKTKTRSPRARGKGKSENFAHEHDDD